MILIIFGINQLNTMRSFALSIIIFCLFTISSTAQQEETSLPKYEIGLEVQAYPTGIIPGFRFEKFLSSKSSINLRLGYQLIDHRDLGKNENETGWGYGPSFAYRRFFNSIDKGLSLALRTDIWFNQIDWEDNNQTGTTDLKIIQPTLMAEYVINGQSKLVISPSLAFGWEWNVVTDGQPTGEGAIILVGCTFGFRK